MPEPARLSCVAGEPAFAHLGRARATPVTPRQRAQASEFIKKHEQISERDCIASIFIVDSKFLRGAVTATMWLVKPPFPLEVVNAWSDLVAALNRYVKQGKLPMDPVEAVLAEES